MKKQIKGPYAVLMTPFAGDVVDKKSFIKQIERINGTGISGYVVNGSTAEFIQLTLDEQIELIDLVAMYKDENMGLIVSACTGNYVDTITLAEHAKIVGADAILVCPPYYFKYSAKEREEYFFKVADLSPVPVILYNVPFFTQELEVDVIYNLFKHHNIIGIKDSSANMKRIMHLISKSKGDEVSILTGTDDILTSALFAGCSGSFTAFAAIFPEKVAMLYKEFNAGNYDKAKQIQEEFMSLLREADSETFPVGYKHLLERASGIPFGNKEI